MKKSVCLYFQVHQPTRLRLYRFFDIGKDSHYYDDYTDRTILHRIAQRCYLPMNQLLLDLIKQYGKDFKVSFSITGSALEQFDRYEPEVVRSFKELADTGQVEFLAEKELVTIIPNFSLDKIYLIGVRTAGPPARSGGLPLPGGGVVGARGPQV